MLERSLRSQHSKQRVRTTKRVPHSMARQGSDGPQYGNVANLEAAKQAFRAAWDRRPKASGKS